MTSSAPRLQKRLDHLVQSRPHEAISLAREHTGATASADDRTVAWTAIGRALYELGDPPRAMAAMRRALAAAREAQPHYRLGALISSAPVAAELGDAHHAQALLDEAEQLATGASLGRVLTQRAFVLQHLGRPAEALAALAAVEPLLRNDPLARLRLTVNRAMILLQLGESNGAEHELRHAARAADRLGQQVIAAGVVSNLAYAYAMGGDLGRALDTYDQAEARYLAAGRPWRAMAVMEIDRASVLQRAGLPGEAMRAAAAAVANASASGSAIALGDAQLCLARARLSAARHIPAVRAAGDAAATFRHAGRPSSSLLARAVQLEAALAVATAAQFPRVAERARRLSARLKSLGWGTEAATLDDARWRSAWATTGAPPSGALDEVDADGDDTPAGSWRALHRRLISLGPDSPDAVIAAAKGTARGLPTEPSAAREGAADVVVGAALLLGHADLALLWAEVRHGAHVPSRPVAGTPGQVLIRYVVDRGQVSAVVVEPRRRRVVPLGSLGELTAAVRRVATAVEQAAGAVSNSASSAVSRSAAAASELLCPTLPNVRRVVVVPCAELQSVPWQALPGLADRAVTVAMSPWRHRVHAAPPADQADVTFVAGPGLRLASSERRNVAAAYPAITVLSGRQATPRRVCAALARPGILHIAAHGELEPGHPDGSALRLAGGSLSARDLAALTARADLVVLTSCATGHSEAVGRDVAGMAHTLLRCGVATVVAPVVAVGHAAAAEFARLFHCAFAAGGSPADCVRSAASEMRAGSPGIAESAAAFVCFGA